MQRVGSVIGLRPEHMDEYKKLHANVWPDVLKKLTECNISNYSIFLREPENLMFAYFEYTGTDMEADMAKIAADPKTQEWWDVCMPLQRALEPRAEGEWWATMPELFHLD